MWPNSAQSSSLLRLLGHSQLDKHKHTDTSSSDQRPLGYPQNTHKIRTRMPSAEFEPATPAIKQLQTCASGRTATGIGCYSTYCIAIYCLLNYDSSTSAVRIRQVKRSVWRRRGGLFEDNTVRD